MAKRIQFIDRDRELAWIVEALLDTQQAHALHIYADGGIGKTRLLQQVHSMLRAPDYNALLNLPKDRKLTIAVVNEFTQTGWADAFMRGVKTTAADMGIKLLETDAQYKIADMIAHLKSTIEKAPDAIVVRLGTDPLLRPVLNDAVKRGIKVLTLDNFLRLMTELTTRIVTQEDNSAMLAARQLVKDIQHRGVVAVLLGQGNSLPERRRDLLTRVLGAYPNIELVVEELTIREEMEAKAYSCTQALLQAHTDLKALWVTWDAFTPGVLRALRDAGRTDVGVYSFDVLSLSDLKALARPESPWRASVSVDPEAVGRSVIHIAALAACDRPIQQHYEIPAHFLNKETVFPFSEAQPHLSQTEPPYLPNLTTLDIIDFDDQAFHDEMVFALKLADMIGEQYFDNFYRNLRYFTELKTQDISRIVLDKQRLSVQQAFITCLQKVSEQQRTVLILDTIEKAQQVIPFIAEVLAATHNVVTVMAGRPDPKSLQLLEAALGERLQSKPLPVLDKEASMAYLQEKQASLHTILDDTFKQNLLRLAQGKPILMELAVEWHARGLVLPWMREIPAGARSTEAPQKQSWEHETGEESFESQLVHHIGQVKNLSDWVTLLLAYVYPLDMAAVGQLLELTPQETERAWNEMQDQFFIKHLPGERITLHDKMRELVNAYVWPDFDRDKSLRNEISQSAVVYLRQQIEHCQTHITSLVETDKAARDTLGTQSELDSWRERQECEEELWLLREQLLQHLLVVDLDAGLSLFFELYEMATDEYRYALRMGWIELVEPYLAQLNPKTQCDVLLCKAKALLDDRQYPGAKEILQDLIQRTEIELYQKVDAHIQLANVVIRQGDLNRGIEEFKSAVEISQTERDKQWLVKAENGLGWAYRLTADLDKAREHYEIALQLALEEDAYPKQQALLYNNLGFLYAYRREIPDYLGTAQRFCNESLRIAKELDEDRSIGRAYCTMGCVCFMGGELERALENFKLALEIFEPKDDEEWLSQVYAWRGAAQMSGPTMDLAAAQSDLELARRINIPKDQPIILSRLALVYLVRGRLEEAENLVEKCRQHAMELPDLWYQWVTIRDLARVARYRNAFSRLPELERMREEHLAQWPNIDQRAHGMLLLELGCLALGLQDHRKAVNYFIKGMEILTTVGKYGGDQPVIFLQRIEQQFIRHNPYLSKKQIADLGRDLSAAWKSGMLHMRYPDIRNIYEHWANWQEVADA